jgi:hypothetical protein
VVDASYAIDGDGRGVAGEQDRLPAHLAKGSDGLHDSTAGCPMRSEFREAFARYVACDLMDERASSLADRTVLDRKLES